MKKIFSFVILLLVIITVSGCSNKNGATEKEFNNIMKKNGFYVEDISESLIGDNVKKVVLATGGTYQIEYYVFTSEDSAKNSFKSNKKIFKNYVKKNTKVKTTSKNNYDFYSVETSSNYGAIARSGKTLLYTWSKSFNKKDIKKMYNKLNY